MLLTGVLLLAAVGLVVVALSTGHAGLAWGSVALSTVVAGMIVVRWRRRWNTPEAEPVELLDDEPVKAAAHGDQAVDFAQHAASVDAAPDDTVHGDQPVDPAQDAAPVDPLYGDQLVHPAQDATPSEPPPQSTSMTAAESDPVVASGASGGADQVAEGAELADAEAAEPGEEDTDAADLLVVYELTDEVLVVDGYPRYHLTRCPRPDRARAERLPVREARELGFTPCDRCRPDTALARRHRASSATAGGS